MWTIDIPGFKKLTIEHLVFDFNGTLAIDGKLIPGVSEPLKKLSEQFELHVITADTFGQAANELKGLPVTLKIIEGTGQAKVKEQFVEDLGKETVIAFGNGRNDRFMLQTAALGIVVFQKEGSATVTQQAATVICPTITDALNLLLNPKRLTATLRD